MAVSAPSRGDWGFLLNDDVVNLFQVMFPYPREVTGGLTEAEFKAMLIEYAFPSPLKVTGGSYRMRSLVSNNKLVSVPYRGNWGVLHMLLQLTKY